MQRNIIMAKKQPTKNLMETSLNPIIFLRKFWFWISINWKEKISWKVVNSSSIKENELRKPLKGEVTWEAIKIFKRQVIKCK